MAITCTYDTLWQLPAHAILYGNYLYIRYSMASQVSFIPLPSGSIGNKKKIHIYEIANKKCERCPTTPNERTVIK
jgi:hypothetical protein